MSADIYRLDTTARVHEQSNYLDEEHKDALMTLGHTFVCHAQNEKAFVIFHALSELFPSDPQPHIWLAYTLLATGRCADALTIIEKLRQLETDNATLAVIPLLRSKVLSRLGRVREARDQLNEHMRLKSIV